MAKGKNKRAKKVKKSPGTKRTTTTKDPGTVKINPDKQKVTKLKK
jgi:hypothetical protein